MRLAVLLLCLALAGCSVVLRVIESEPTSYAPPVRNVFDGREP